MITLLTGDNHFLLSKRRSELVAAFLLEQPDGFGYERFDAEDDETARITDAMTVLPFLSPKRLVLVSNATRATEAARAIQTLLASVPDNTHLIFVEPAPDRRTSLYKALQKAARTETFETLRGQGLHVWLVSYAREHGFELANAGASELSRRVGGDQWALAHEIQKLALLGTKSVDQDSVKRYVEPTLRDSIFDLLELLLEGKSREALRVYRELRASRVESHEIMAMIGWQFQLLTAAVLGATRSTSELARETGFKPFSLERVAVLSRRLGLPALRAILQILCTVDGKLKSSRADKDALLELALIRSANLLAR